MDDSEPIQFQRGVAEASSGLTPHYQPSPKPFVAFDRRELDTILRVYGRMVAAGEWRDYAIDHRKEEAVFSIFRRSSELPLFQVIKNPKLAKKQGAYSVVSVTGVILKRGRDLRRVLAVFDKRKLEIVS
ncbi:MAG: DUF2794 domain-containing protein [Pseudomonadota bacterium]